MGQKRRHHPTTKSHTLPSSPTHSSSSSSDFEFTISLSPRKSSAALCPADELFYKGQLLPLHLSPRLSMVRTLLLSSPSTSSDTTTTTSRDSSASRSSTDCDSSRPSSVTDDEFKRLNPTTLLSSDYHPRSKPSKYFSLSKFSSVFRKEPKNAAPAPSPAVKRVSSSAKDVIRKYFNKVKPLYEKLSQKQQQQQQQQKVSATTTLLLRPLSSSRISSSTNTNILPMTKDKDQELTTGVNYRKEASTTRTNLSFSGNLRYPRGSIRSCISSCPSSMGSSPSHVKSGFGSGQTGRVGFDSDHSSMEELQSAIQGAIAHCKNSMVQNKTMVSHEI